MDDSSDDKNGSEDKKDEIHDETEDTYVKLISRDEHEFILKRKHVLAAAKFKDREDDLPDEIELNEISSCVLQKLCIYLTYKVYYTDCDEAIPEFEVEPELAVELLKLADDLDC